MEFDLLKTILATAGLGGLCVGIFFLLFRKIIGAKFLSTMTKEHSYKIVNNIIISTCSIAVLGLTFWFLLQRNVSSDSNVENTSAQVKSKAMLTLNTRKENKLDPHNSKFEVEVDVDYIQIRNLDNPLLQKVINDTLRNNVRADETFEEENWQVDVSSYLIKGDLISVLSNGYYYYHGAANGGNVIISTNLNIKTGDKVEFKDIFKSGYQEKINKLTLSALKEQSYGEFFDGLKDDQCYYFSDEYLYLCFDEYEVAPGVAGAVTVEIPLSKIRDIISLNGPLAHTI